MIDIISQLKSLVFKIFGCNMEAMFLEMTVFLLMFSCNVSHYETMTALNNSASLFFSMFCSHGQAFKNITRSSCILTVCFSLFVEIVKRKKMLSSTCNELTLFLILESVSMIIILRCCKNKITIFSKSVSNFLFVQIVSYCFGKKHFKKYFIQQC